MSLLGGIGFTASLLVAKLSIGHGSTYGDQVTAGVLFASLIASLLAAGVLLPRTGTNGHSKAQRLARRPDAAVPSESSVGHAKDLDGEQERKEKGGQI